MDSEDFTAKKICEFKTTQCTVEVYETDFQVNGEFVYIVSSDYHKTKRNLTRFGNLNQTISMVNSYKILGSKLDSKRLIKSSNKFTLA